MKKILVFILVLAGFSACKKDKTTNTAEAAVELKNLPYITSYIGDTVNVVFEVRQTSGTSEMLTLSIEDLPKNSSVSFISDTGIPPFYAIFAVTSTKDALKGTYPIKIVVKTASGATKIFPVNFIIMDTIVIPLVKSEADTTYTAAIESPQQRNVFIEQFSGASCTNCPVADEALNNMLADHPGNIIIANYYTFNGSAIFKPVNKPGYISKFDFRDSNATRLGNDIFGGVNSIPVAGIDRIQSGGTKLFSRTDWVSRSTERLAMTSEANLYLNSSYNSRTNMVTVKAKVAYTQALSADHILTLEVVEDNIVDLQETIDSTAVNYVHNHVLRQCLTPNYGKTILADLTTKEAGRVYEYTYTFKPYTFFDLNNCKIIAVLSNSSKSGDDRSVLQTQQTNLK